jgi:hypothetical protein
MARHLDDIVDLQPLEIAKRLCVLEFEIFKNVKVRTREGEQWKKGRGGEEGEGRGGAMEEGEGREGGRVRTMSGQSENIFDLQPLEIAGKLCVGLKFLKT